jgi:Flp pilus assembly protein TadD
LEEADQAVSDWNKAIELNPQDALSHVNIGYVLLDKDRLEEALPYFQKARDLGLSEVADEVKRLKSLLITGMRRK